MKHQNKTSKHGKSFFLTFFFQILKQSLYAGTLVMAFFFVTACSLKYTVREISLNDSGTERFLTTILKVVDICLE